MDKSFYHFGPIFALLPSNNSENLNFGKTKKNSWRYYHFTHVCHKRQLYDVWFLRYTVGQTKFFVILCHFLPFHSTNNLKNQNFEKMKKAPGDNIMLPLCITNDNHMMYGSLRYAVYSIRIKTGVLNDTGETGVPLHDT